MRFLHTSDWHLGQLFYQYDRADEHARFLSWLGDTLVDTQADALLVAGDVFDHANPSAAAQRLFYTFLTDATRRLPHLSIVIVSGNHDSPARLEAPAPFFDAMGITVVGQVPRNDDGRVDVRRLVVPLNDARGETRAWCLAVPFLRTGDLPAADAPVPTRADDGESESNGDGDGGEPDSGYAAGVARLYNLALAHADALRTPRQPVVALGHCAVQGGVLSADSERPILAGGLDALVAESFDARLAYVALGHLHRAQEVVTRTTGADGRVRYSGSPLPLSFAEVDYQHQVLCVDLDEDGVADVHAIRVPRFAQLWRIPEEPEPPEAVMERLAALEVNGEPDALPPYVEVRVLVNGPEPGLRARIEEALADKPVRLARIDTTYVRAEEADLPDTTASLADLSALRPEDVFVRLHERTHGSPPARDLLEAFGELLRAPAAEEQA